MAEDTETRAPTTAAGAPLIPPGDGGPGVSTWQPLIATSAAPHPDPIAADHNARVQQILADEEAAAGMAGGQEINIEGQAVDVSGAGATAPDGESIITGGEGIDRSGDSAMGNQPEAGSVDRTIADTQALANDSLQGGQGNDSITGGAEREADKLGDPSDDQVIDVLREMVDAKTDLTQAGKPEVGAANSRLEAQGLGPINAARRDALFERVSQQA